jgi:regulator of protease activity HflC (stomatin/prohibitin superfamily)
MGKLIFGGLLLLIAFFLMLARSGSTTPGVRQPACSGSFPWIRDVRHHGHSRGIGGGGRPGPSRSQARLRHGGSQAASLRHSPGGTLVVDRALLGPEEQYPAEGEQVETIAALSSEQMGMTVDAGLRWQINPQDAPKIFNEIGKEEQIHSIVRNAIRKGVRDGMVRFSINDISQRTKIAEAMQALVDSALITQPRAGGEPFRIAEVTAFFLRDLQPPEQVVQAINNKIAQEQQIETERHRVEVARLQSDQQRLLNQTLTPRPDQAIPRGTARHEVIEQFGRAGSYRRWATASRYRQAQIESQAVILADATRAATSPPSFHRHAS